MPYIVARGRKGGSNVAAAVMNALFYMAADDDKEWRRCQNDTYIKTNRK